VRAIGSDSEEAERRVAVSFGTGWHSARRHAVTPHSSAPGCANRLATVVRRAPAASSERGA